MPESPNGPAIDRSRLLEQIRALFSDGELRDLCLDLSVDYENLPGEGKGDKARELILFMQRVGRLDDLVHRATELRPHLGLNIKALAEEIGHTDPARGAGLTGLIDQFP